ncbi:MAG: FadR/GntR family transcriptional regulator [Candidatus Limnocylindrales bacterium]
MSRDDPGAAGRTAEDAGPGWPQFAVLNRSTLPDEIASRLLELIRAQELRPGDKLPAERTLAQLMQVSRPVLREALRALSIMKVVEIRQGAGTYITALEPQQLVSHLDFVFSKDSVALANVLEARRVVEVGNVRLAAQRVGPAELAELDAIVARLRTAVGDAERFSDLDIAFHNAVCEAADNFLLAQFMRIINTLAKVSRERTGATRAFRERALADHEPILAALRAGDPDAAAAAMQAHLDHVESALGSGGPSLAAPEAATPARLRLGATAVTTPAPSTTPAPTTVTPTPARAGR